MAAWTRLTGGLLWVATMLLSSSIISGCGSIGPTSVNRDRFDYITAISESWKQQTFLNIVRLRYADAPVFLEVAKSSPGTKSKAHSRPVAPPATRPHPGPLETL